MQNIHAPYITELSGTNIAQYTADHKPIQFNSDVQKSIPTKDKINNIITIYGTNLNLNTETIVSEALKQYEINNKVHLSDTHKENIIKILTDQLNNNLTAKLGKDFYPELVINKEKIKDILTKELGKIKINVLFNKFANFNEENLSKITEELKTDNGKVNSTNIPENAKIPKNLLEQLSTIKDLSQKEQELLKQFNIPHNTNTPKSPKIISRINKSRSI